jgi:hypothetical protein
MRLALRVVLMVVCIACLALLASLGPLDFATEAQEGSAAAAWLDLVNETRLDEGLDPYAESRLLSSAAQRHADDLAENGPADPDDLHRGSDDSDGQERIDEAGYAAWTKDGELVVAENVWVGRGAAEDALASFLEDEAYRGNLLSDALREMGVGVVSDAEGRSVYVLDFGARPNVLPIFINDGAASTENREVAIRLTNERVRPEGEGASFIGEAIEIRMSNEPSFEELAWDSWAPLVSWVLPDVAGEHTVYVQFRDAAGRTAASADGIFLDHGTPATPTVTPPTAAASPPATDTAAPPTPMPASSATPGPATSGAEAEPTSAVSTATSTPSSLVSRATPFPTWTPLPSPTPTSVDPDEPGDVTLALPEMGGYSRPLVIVGVLQGVVVILGLYWVVRRGKGV